MSRPRSLLLGAALLGVLLLLAYARSLGGGFLWDDDLHITANPVIVGPLGLKEIWTTSRANYFPLVLTNFKLQHALWSLNPAGYRCVTLAFHLGAALLLWRVLRELRVPGAWLGAALWALHPVQVESVAWICELKNTQSAVFFLAAIWCWLRWLQRGAGRDYGWAAVWALAAILSKPSTVMLPAALALCAWWVRGRVTRSDLVRLWPFVALSALAAGWTIWEQKVHSGASGPEWAQSGLERSIIASRALWFYLGKLVWPADLSFLYPRWTIEATSPLAYLPLLGAIMGSGYVWQQRRRWRGLALAAGYFGALLFPVLGFFDVYFFRYSFVGDHFQYLASMAPLALLAAIIATVLPQKLPWIGGSLIAALALATSAQSGDYLSSETLWRATVARNPGSATAWAQWGAVHERASHHAEAIACFRRALSLNPQHPEARNHLGVEYLRQGQVREAIAELEKAISARPDFAEAHNNLGLALLQEGRANEALPHIEQALALRPDAAEPRATLATALATLGRGAEALPVYEEALRLAPNRAQTHDEFGAALASVGRAEEAFAHYSRALELQPDLASAHNNLGILFAQQGRMLEALAEFDAAIRSDPNYAAAHLNRGGALTRLERLPEARDAFARSAELQPDSPKAHAYLAQLLQALGQEREARAHFERAEQLERAAPTSGR